MAGRLTQATLVVAVLALVVSACGGGAPATTQTQAPPSSAAPATPAEQAPTDAAQTEEPTVGEGGGTGSGDGVCLVTAAEAGQIMDIAGVTAGSAYTGSTACTYMAAGDPVGLAQVTPDGRSSFELMNGSEGLQPVDGLGDDAFFDPNTASLAVLKGSAMYSISAGNGDYELSQRLDWAKQFATIALSRMP